MATKQKPKWKCPIEKCGTTALAQPINPDVPPACSGQGKHAPKDMKEIKP